MIAPTLAEVGVYPLPMGPSTRSSLSRVSHPCVLFLGTRCIERTLIKNLTRRASTVFRQFLEVLNKNDEKSLLDIVFLGEKIVDVDHR